MTTHGQVSTAMLVAAAEVMDGRGARRDELRTRLARACLQGSGPPGKRLLRMVDSGPGRTLLRALEAATLPGIAAHYAWRKRRIHAWAEQAVTTGVQQLLVLGAGFDALGPLMANAHPTLRVFEVDRPAAIAVRRQALQRCGVAEDTARQQAADLGCDGLVKVLRDFERTGLERDATTMVVAEGLLMYLRPTAVATLFRDLRAGLGGRVHVIGSAMDRDERGIPRFQRQRPWLRHWLARRGEPFAWGATRGELPARLAAWGIDTPGIAAVDDPRDPDPCPGEWLFRGGMRR